MKRSDRSETKTWEATPQKEHLVRARMQRCSTVDHYYPMAVLGSLAIEASPED